MGLHRSLIHPLLEVLFKENTLHLCAAWFLALQALIVIESSVLLNSFSQGVFLLMLFLHLSLQANLTLRNLVIFKLNLTITETS